MADSTRLHSKFLKGNVTWKRVESISHKFAVVSLLTNYEKLDVPDIQNILHISSETTYLRCYPAFQIINCASEIIHT